MVPFFPIACAKAAKRIALRVSVIRCLFVALLLIGKPLFAVEPPKIEEFTLDNGMHVIVVEDHRVPAVSHNLLMRLGAADDPRGKSGLAHYLEHMLFQGTEQYKPNEFSKIVASHGGQTNAFTTADYTGYWVNIAKEHLPLVMKLEADRLQHLNPPEQDFLKEQQVILEERRSRVDTNPSALFAEQMDALLYYHHPYGTPIIGWANEMAALNRDDVMAYYQRYYKPEHMVLVLSGDVTQDEAKDLVEAHYEGLKNDGAEPVPMRNREPQQRGPRQFEMHHALVTQPNWQRSMLAPSYNWQKEEAGEHILPLMIAEHLLGGSKTSRLYTLLVEEKALATSVSVSYNPFRLGPGEFSIYVTPKEAKDLPEIERLIEAEIVALQKQAPSKEELKRAKTQMIAANVFLRDGLQSLARVVGHLAMIQLPLDYYFTWEEKVEAVTAQQVSKSLAVLDHKASVTGVLLPEASKETAATPSSK